MAEGNRFEIKTDKKSEITRGLLNANGKSTLGLHTEAFSLSLNPCTLNFLVRILFWVCKFVAVTNFGSIDFISKYERIKSEI